MEGVADNLRQQTYLKLCGISHRTVASNNHASPSGALPFLLPGPKDETAGLPVASNRLKRWVAVQQKAEKKEGTKETEDVRYEAYHSLLEGPIRVAWVRQIHSHHSTGQANSDDSSTNSI